MERIAVIGGQDFEYGILLQHVENKIDYKHLPDNSELRLIRDSIPRLGIVGLDTGARLIVRDATASRQEIIITYI